MSKTISNVIQASAVDAGQAVEVTVELKDGTIETIRCEAHDAPNLVRALIQAAAAAEQLRKQLPGQPLSIERPFRATNVAVGEDVRGEEIVMKFSTTDALPVLVAMPKELAQRAISRLRASIDRLGRQSIYRKN